MTDPDDQRSVAQDAASAPVRRMLGFVERIGLAWEPAQLAHPTLLTDFGRDAQGPHVYPAMRRWLRE